MKAPKYLSLLLGVYIFFPFVAQAQQQTTWIGPSYPGGPAYWEYGPWTNGWAAGDTAVFSNSSNANPYITLLSNDTVSGIIDTSGNPITLEEGSLSSTTSTLTIEVDGYFLSVFSDVSSIQNIKKTGVGTLRLGYPNSGTGSIDIEGGAVEALSAQALPSGAITDNGQLGFFNTQALTSTLTNSVTGTGGMYIWGPAGYNVTLAGANTFSGTTDVDYGATVVLGNSLALQNSLLLIDSYSTPGQLAFSSTVTSHAFTIGGLTGSVGFALQDNAATPNAVVLSIGGNSVATSTYTGALTGSGSVNKMGTNSQTLSGANGYMGGTTVTSGTLVLSGANTYSGGTTVNGGLLQLSGAGTLGSSTGSLTMNGGTLDLGKTIQTIGALTGTSGTILNNGGGSSILTVGNGDATSSYSGVIANHATGTGSVLLTKIGAGTLTLSGANTFSGKLTIDAGTVSVGTIAGHSTAQPLGTGGVSFGGASSTAPGVLQYTGGSTTMASVNYVIPGDYGTISNTGGGVLTLSLVEPDEGATINLSGGKFQVNGGFDLQVSETLNVTNGANVIFVAASGDTGSTMIDSTSSLTIGANGTTGNLSSGPVTNNGTLSYALSNAFTETNTIGGNGLVEQVGTGATAFTGRNTYTGGTSVASGSLFLNNTSGSGAGTGSLTVAAGATMGGTGSYGATGTPGAGFSIAGTGTATGQRANVLSGMASASDTNTTQSLTMIASGTATITNANLTFNINDQIAGQGTELNVGSTSIAFGAGVQSTTLTLNIENVGVIGTGTMYVLIAGNTAGGVDQYSGLSLGTGTGNVTTGLLTPILNSGAGQSGNLTLALSGLPNTWYGARSELFLYQNSATGTDNIEVEFIPEPRTGVLLLGGLAFLVVWQRRKRNLE